MEFIEHSRETDAPAHAIFALYADAEGWTSWDHKLEQVTLEGAFEVGTSGTLTPQGMGALPFTLTEVTPGRSFSDETPVMGAVLRFVHTLQPVGDGRTRVTHRVEVDGPAAAEVAPHVLPGIDADLPVAIEALCALAQRTSVTVGG